LTACGYLQQHWLQVVAQPAAAAADAAAAAAAQTPTHAQQLLNPPLLHAAQQLHPLVALHWEQQAEAVQHLLFLQQHWLQQLHCEVLRHLDQLLLLLP
jgi:hypothetical protein